MPHSRITLQTIERIGRQADIPEIESELGKVLPHYGFTAFCLLDLPEQATGATPTFLLDTTPAGWRETYLDGDFYANDHIARFGRTAKCSFDVRSAPYSPAEEKTARRLFGALASFGIPDGLVVPLSPVQAGQCGAYLSGRNINPDSDATRDAEILMLYAAYRLRALRHHTTETLAHRLSAREREVLQWTTQGKTAWEIGEILHISEAAVNNLIAAAMTKLDTVSKSQAVAMAIRTGEIDL